MTAHDRTPTDAEEVAQKEIIFPEGLIGLEEWKRYILVGETPDNPVMSLQSLDESGVAFWVVDPYLFVPDYEVQLSDADTVFLKVQDVADLVVLVTLTVRENEVTANLLGPLVINSRARLGKQIVMAESHYSVRHPVQMASDEAAAESAATREEMRAG